MVQECSTETEAEALRLLMVQATSELQEDVYRAIPVKSLSLVNNLVFCLVEQVYRLGGVAGLILSVFRGSACCWESRCALMVCYA
jgi:hypothetical protein